VTHTCNPSYSEGTNQEDHSSKPAQANGFVRSYLKKPITKKGWWSGSRCRPQHHKKEKRRKKRKIKRQLSFLKAGHHLFNSSWLH
jgi:hypothetical protein